MLSVDIFYDFRPVHGAIAMAESLWRRLWSALEGKTLFLQALARTAGDHTSPFGFFGNLQTDHGRVDVKLYGLKHVVTAARILAMRHRVLERATMMRYNGVIGKGLDKTGDLEILVEAQRLFLTQIARQQLRDMAIGKSAENKVDATLLTRSEQLALKNALKDMDIVVQIVRDQLTA